MRFVGDLDARKIIKPIKRKFLKLFPYKTTVHEWYVLQSFKFYFDDNFPKHYILVESGWYTDLASVPGFFGFVIQKDGVFAQAAVMHDWSYKNRGDVVYVEPQFEGGVSIKGAPLTREEQDRAFLNGMKILGTSLPVRASMWWAVHRFGWISYPKKRINNG